jgi:hypothetical protein
MYEQSNLLYKNFSFDDYVGEVVGEVSQTLIPLTKIAVKSCYGSGRVEYRYINDENVYIWWIPTVPDVEADDFKYYVVVLKFLDGVDRETYVEESYRVFSKYFDLKRCDSGSIFVISPRLRYTHICRLKHFGRKAYLKWMNLAKCGSIRVRAFPIVAKTPEKAIHRIFKFMYIFLSKRMHALAEKVGISPKLYDYNPMKLYSLITNNIYTVSRGLVRSFIEYMAKLTMHIHSKLVNVVRTVKVKASILNSLKQLGIPAHVMYTLFKQPLNMIMSIAKQWRIRLRMETSRRDDYEYGFKIINMLQKGNYVIAT